MSHTGERTPQRPSEALPPAPPGAANLLANPADAPQRLSPAQERLWSQARLRPDAPAHQEAWAIELAGRPDPSALEAALRAVLEHHPALRAVLPADHGHPTVALAEAPPRVLAVEDVSAAADPEAQLRQRLREEARRPFDVERGPLYRFLLLEAREQHVLLIAFHHLAADAQSFEALWSGLSQAYEAVRAGQAPKPTPQNGLEAPRRPGAADAPEAEQLAAWTRELADVPATLDLPTDHPRPAALGEGGASTPPVRLNPAAYAALQALCQARQVTPAEVLYTAFVALLHRYSQQDDLCAGVLALGSQPSTGAIAGPLSSPLPVRARPRAGMPFSELLDRSRQALRDAAARRDVPLEHVLEALHLEPAASHAPLFHVVFDATRDPVSLGKGPGALGARRARRLDAGVTRFDLILRVAEDASGVELSVDYHAALYEAATAQRLLSHYARLLSHALEAPATPLSGLRLLDESERRLILEDFNATAAPFDSSATVLTLFDAQVEARPDAVALVARDGTLTYRQLQTRARALAAHLAALGAGPESVVGLCLERTSELVVSQLAILYAGAAYLPLEPTHPRARRAALLARNGARLLVSRPALVEGLESDARLVLPDAVSPTAPLRPPGPGTLAYIISTSGSTGEPKGIEISHQNLVHAFASFDPDYDPSPGSRWLALTSYTFDTHCIDTLYPLGRGGTVVLRDVGPQHAGRDILQHAITHLVIVPSSLVVAAEEPGAVQALRSLRVLVAIGEHFSPQVAQLLAPPQGKMLNAYGPTEATIVVSAFTVRPGERVRIGGPAQRSRFYVVDPRGEPVPLGVPGELLIGGDSLGRGYRGRPDLTAERFIPDRYSGVPGARLYRTGDRVKWHADGTLSFLGRIDFQVKVRGVRIEIEEVEAALHRAPGVRKAAVLAQKHHGDTRLTAFVLLEPGAALPAVEGYLTAHLPDAFVPARLVAVEKLPLTTSGKVDRKALPALLPPEPEAAHGEPPQGPSEELLASLFCQLLQVERVGREDNFFALGGHSLSAVHLLARVHQAFGVELPLTALASAPTVAALARALEQARSSAAPLPDPAPRPQGAPALLSPAQERMWFLHQLQPDSAAYHLLYAYELEGPVSAGALDRALRLLLERHRALRIALPVKDGRPQPVFLDVPAHALAQGELDAASGDDPRVQARLREEARRSYDFERGPLYRFQLLKLSSGRHVLALAFHHLVTDGLSADVLLRELAAAYAALSRGEPPALPPSGLDYADLAAWQRSEAVAARHEAQLGYWTRQLAGVPTVLELPTDLPRPSALSDRGRFTPRVRLPPALTRSLDDFCRQHQVTRFMALYAGFIAVLHRYSQQTDFCVGTPTSGRTHLAAQDVVGLFVNTLPLRARLRPEMPFSELLAQARQATLEAVSHQDVPLERIVDALGVPRALSHMPLFQVLFDMRDDRPLTRSAAELGARPLPAEAGTVPFDLVCSIVEEPAGLELYLEYSTDLFEARTAERMLARYVQLLSHALEAPATPLSRLRLLDSAERQRVVEGFNATRAPFDAQATLASLFDAQATRNPDAVAVVARDGTLTFGQLQARARRLAGHLAALGARPETVVGLCLERESELLVGLLGILYSGAAYLPLEPTHPPARRAELLARSGARLLVTRPALFDGVAVDARMVTPDAEGPSATPTPASAENLLCLLYTSGSTGEPKGVEQSHRNLVHAFAAFDPYYDTRPGDCWAASATIAFDMHLEELLFSLTRGARILLRGLGPQHLGRDIQKHGVTHVVATPSSLAVALEEGGPEPLRALRVVVSGGEVLPDALVRQLGFTATKLVNTYGPTETSINVTAQYVYPGQAVRLGKPLDRARVYVLSPEGELSPPGVPGELFIGGECVGRGYRARAELTAERFVPDAFSGVPGARLYRTGDKVKWNEDGTLSFLGRTDFQVKLRGIRIELEEVEAALLRAGGVRQAAVVAQKLHGDTRLVAFVALEPATTVKKLEDSLAAALPDALVPSRFVAVDALPLNSSGKVNRQALAALVPAEPEAPAPAQAPQGQSEALLAQLFSQLLHAERVGREDDFFSLGGNSLSAIQLLARVRQAFNVELPLATLFANPSVAGLARALERTGAPAGAPLPGPTPRPPGAPRVLSPAQERLWFLQQLHPDSCTYHVPDAFELEGPLSTDALERGLRLLLERYPVLRTAIRAQDGQPAPYLAEVPAQLLSVEELPAAYAGDAPVQRRLRDEARRLFDMERGPLYRFRLFRLAPQKHVLFLAFHHIIVDGISADLLMRELSAAYEAFSRGHAPSLPPTPAEHADVAAWLRSDAVRARDEAQLAYWTRQLGGAPDFLELPTDLPRPAVLHNDRAALTPTLHLPATLSRALSAFCRRHEVTPFMALYAAYVALLHRYTQQDDFCVGTPTSGRTHAATEGVVGLFVNTLALRARPRAGMSFSELLAHTRQTTLEAFSHQDAPFERVIDALQLPRNLSHAPLFQAFFAWQEGAVLGALGPGLTSRPLEVDQGDGTFDVTLRVLESDGGLRLYVEYNTDLYEAKTAQRLLGHYVQLLSHALESPSTTLSRLRLMEPGERRRLLEDFNATRAPFDSAATVTSLLDAQADARPNATAVIAQDRSLTYGELRTRARRLAGHLAALGAGPESIVGLCLSRDSELFVGLFGILYAGAGYLPLEPNHPPARRAELLARSGARLLVSRPGLFPGVELDARMVAPDAEGPSATPTPPSPENLAQVLYTSGSTGEPKGAELNHRNLVHAFASFDREFAAGPDSRWLALTSVSFDLHSMDALYGLTRGSTIVLRPVGPQGMGRDIQKHGITHVMTTPSSVAAAGEEEGAVEAFRSLRVLSTAGERLAPQVVELLAPRGGGKMLNGYGPTETTIICNLLPVRPGQPIRLGPPADRTTFYVLDPSGELCPAGVPGELFIGGDCVCRDYRHRPDLTAERFVPDPFGATPGARLYKSGDKVKWHEDGTLSFLGRTDLQVKVRGVRIEPEEVEAALLRAPGVRQGAVIAQAHGGELRLVAFAALAPDASPEQVEAHLAARLPDAMVPSRLVVLDALPLTADRGKVDRKALPALIPAEQGAAAGQAPRGPFEELLAQLFRPLLHVERVGREDDFFSLGGNSLSAIQLGSRVRQAFGVEVPLTTLFANPSIAALARVLEQPQAQATALPGPTPRMPGAAVALSPAQERMWFLQQLQPSAATYHVPEALELTGALSVDALERGLRLMLERHTALRARFRAEDGRPVASTGEVPARALTVEDLSKELSSPDAATLARRLGEEARRPFDLERGPLYRFHLFRLAPQRHVLLLVIHHLVVDGLSLDVLLRELSAAYAALARGQAPSLPPLSLEYADAAAWLRSDAIARRGEAQLAYWTRQLADAPAMLELPTDYPRPAALRTDLGALTPRVRLPAAVTRALQAFCRQHQATPFMALYAAFAALLHRYSQQSDFCVGTPASGRTHAATEGLVGLFVNTLALRARPHAELPFSELLSDARKTTLDAFAHQDVPLDRLVEALHVPRSLDHTPLFQVLFAWQPQAGAGSLGDLDARSLDVDPGGSDFDLTLGVLEADGGFELSLAYSTALFEPATAQRMLGHYAQLLAHALEAPQTPLGRLRMMAPEERRQVLVDFNANQAPFDTSATLPALFDARVAAQPDAVALVAQERSLTFRELQGRARALAGHLAALGAGPETVVGICLERSADLVISELAALYAGAAYLPLESTQPPARRAELLARAGARFVISRPALFSGVGLDLPLVAPDAAGPQATPARAAPENIAYVLFTSGSTGEPKAVEVTHRNLVHAFDSFDPDYELRPGHRWLAIVSVGFDVHAVDTLYALTRGATVVLRETGPAQLGRDLVQHRITHLQFPPAFLPTVLDEPGGIEALRGVSRVIVGGVSLTPQAAEQLAPRNGRLLNCYGPAEATIQVTAHHQLPNAPIRIGKPEARARLYVLDPQGEPVPPGVPGELFIGGEGVSRGYRRRPDLTAPQFVPDPFSGVPGARLYRTGDRVKWSADGVLSFVGRGDSQVKVRGVRVELDEVESALSRLPGVRQAIVVAQPHRGDTRLLAFVTLQAGASGRGLRDALVATLPEAFVPARITALETLPLTPNGKVDRRALAALPFEDEAARASEPPRTPAEERVAREIAQLLGVERVGRDENFFGLGGNSLLASQLVYRLRRAFGAELPLTAAFSSPTVAGLAALLEKAPGQASAPGLTARPRPARVPASLVQERLWYALQMPNSPPVVIITALLLEGRLDAGRLERAITAVLERNETLRSTFYVEDNTVYVRTNPVAQPVLTHRDLSHLGPEAALRAARELFAKRAWEHLDTARGPLYRFELLKLDATGERHLFLSGMSHLVIDGLGTQLFLEELEAAWREAGQPGAKALLPPRTLQYADFALAQRDPGYQQRLDASLESWKQALAGTSPAMDLPVDFPRRDPTQNANMRDVRRPLSAEDVRAFKALARGEGASTFTAALAAMQAWLHRLSGDAHVVTLANISGRALAETEGMVGYFTNLVPLHTDVSGEPSFRELLGRAKGAVEHATAHQEVPLKRIVDALHPAPDASVLPLGQTLLVVEDAQPARLDGLTVSSLDGDEVSPAYELILGFEQRPDGGMSLRLSYDSMLFTEETARRLASAFEQLFLAASRMPDVPISRLPLLSPAQRAEALSALAGPAEAVSPDTCVHTLFERQVLRTPELPAVAQIGGGGGVWSYAELNSRANRMAAELLAAGLAPEERVGVVMEPSLQGMAVLLGILKAGGAYVPLDATWPEARKRLILERSGVRRLFVDAPLLESHRTLAERVAVPEQPASVPRDVGPGPRRVSGAQLAYIVFTSGSTGEPKGVMVQHGSVVNHNLAMAARFGLKPGDRMLQFAPLSFDAAAEDLYPPLVSGATVVMKNGLMPAHSLSPWIERERITVISLPPTYIEEWVREMAAQGQRVPPQLRLLAPGGDVLKRETYEAWVRVGGGHAPWLNVYGPTECTITSATCDIPGQEGVGEAPTFPIGRPIPNVRFYLLDAWMEPVPPGLAGRVFIGGVALARGYLGAPDATARSFVPDPFAGVPGARMYDTGDLAKRLPDGRLRFIGRADHQVKIRGFRVELSEIERHLRAFPGVQEAVVLARTSAATGTKQLFAWVQAPSTVRLAQLREHVHSQLPPYMVPAGISVMEQLPVNANGKIDLRALPDPEPAPSAPQAPQTQAVTTYRSVLELLLARLWNEVLGREVESMTENFFDLGGDSILGMRLLARIEEEVGIAMPMAILFQSPVLHEMASALRDLIAEGEGTSTLVRLSGPDTPIDAPPVFFLHAGDGEVYHYPHLAKLLEPRFRSFGVQAPETLSGRTFPDMDARVAAYVKDIRAVQPHGPYRLVGFSFGGYPALGVAAALEAAGEEVGLLAFLDVAAGELIQQHQGAPRSPWHEVALEFGIRDEAFLAQLETVASPEERWDLVAQRAKELGMVAPHADGRDLARVWHVLGEVLAPQAQGWKVPALRARLLLFASEGTRGRAGGDETLGWQRHLGKEQIEVVPLPGTHESILRPPVVDALGPKLLAALERVRGA